MAELAANWRREYESDKLLTAHFADAIDLDTLKRHQDCIRAGLADLNRHLAEHSEHRAYAHSGDADRRIANQAFYTRLDITDDEQLRPTLAEPFATIFREAHGGGDEGKEAKREHRASFDVVCSRKTLWVDRGRLQSHEWKRVERLEAVWELAKRGLGSSGSTADSRLAGAVTEPTRRSRTPLTAKQIDAIQTARNSGESVISIARRFEVSRMTVWENSKPKATIEHLGRYTVR